LASALLSTLAVLAAPGVPGARAQAPDTKEAPKAEDKARDPKGRDGATAREARTVVEPVAWRVYQRNGQDQADIPIVLGEGIKADSIAAISISGPGIAFGTGTYRDGKLVGVPTGGPYTINITFADNRSSPGDPPSSSARGAMIFPVYVGDLWVLAGQSNMEGYANLVDLTPPDDRVALLGMDGRWGRAEEPLHWLVDSPDRVHSGNPETRAGRSEAQHRTRTKGAGLGLPFGVVMAAATNVPVGLVACAHGGTSMKQWDPALKDKGGESLYGSMLRQVTLAGGRARGVLWYQGESDANGGAADAYPKVFADFIAAVRDDLHDPDLPFYLVQIGRYVNPKAPDPKGWNAVQDAQRQIPDRVANTAVVAAVDLELDDGIHVGTQGQKRLGQRLARIAQRELFGQTGATTPTFERVTRRGDNSLLIKFKGVNRTPVAESATMAPPSPFGAAPSGVPLLSAPRRPAAAGPQLGGLRPSRHIVGFSIRKDDGTEVPLIHDAAVGQSPDTVVLKLVGKAIPEGLNLWYGYGLDPYCNLADGLDMAVPVFGPIRLDDVK
jgi:sialate O-acetylesterase